MAAIALKMSFTLPTADHVTRIGQQRAADGAGRDKGYASQRRKTGKRYKTTFERREVSDPSGAQKK
jgi:hypothetical protein